MKFRQNLYIDARLSDALEALAASPGATKSGIVSDALAAYLAQHGGQEIDDRLKIRLDRMSREMHRVARDVEVLLESLSLFIRFQLSVTAPLAETDHAARAIGRQRFEAFVAQVGRQIAGGQRSIGPSRDEGGTR